MLKLAILFLAVFTISCTHTVDFRSNRFAVPHVSAEKFGGQVSMVGNKPIQIEFVSDISSNPPTRSGVVVEGDLDDVFSLFLNRLSVDLDVGLWGSGAEFYRTGSESGLRWQFLGYGTATDVWVASLQAGLGEFNSKSSRNNDTASSDINSSSKGLSLGYRTADLIVYTSYILEKIDVETRVVNTSGSFGPYSDSGEHNHLALGISNYAEKFHVAFELSAADISWNSSAGESQSGVAVRLGYQW